MRPEGREGLARRWRRRYRSRPSQRCTRRPSRIRTRTSAPHPATLLRLVLICTALRTRHASCSSHSAGPRSLSSRHGYGKLRQKKHGLAVSIGSLLRHRDGGSAPVSQKSPGSFDRDVKSRLSAAFDRHDAERSLSRSDAGRQLAVFEGLPRLHCPGDDQLDIQHGNFAVCLQCGPVANSGLGYGKLCGQQHLPWLARALDQQSLHGVLSGDADSAARDYVVVVRRRYVGVP